MVESIGDLLALYRLRLLGHFARMLNTRQPKKLLFGWLPKSILLMGLSFIGRTRSVRIWRNVKSVNHIVYGSTGSYQMDYCVILQDGFWTSFWQLRTSCRLFQRDKITLGYPLLGIPWHKLVRLLVSALSHVKWHWSIIQIVWSSAAIRPVKRN